MRPRQLTHLRAGQAVAEYLLDLPSVVVGRGRSADIRLDDNAVASRQHCVVLTRGDVHVVEDMGGANGTFVGEERIKAHTLRHGDRIVIGHDVLRYEFAMRTARSLRAARPAEDAAADVISLDHVEAIDTATDLARIGEANRIRGETETAVRERTAVASKEQLEEALALMKVRSGPHLAWDVNGVERYVALGEGPFRIGRGEGAGFTLPGTRWWFGATPAQLVREGHGFSLVPLSPTWNPVRMGEVRLRKVRPLQDGDSFEIEGLRFRYYRGERR